MELDDTTNPISPGYPNREGTITGFNQVVDDTVNTILTRGWSKEQLHQAILNFREKYGSGGLQQMLTILMAHLTDFNNPHKVTLDQMDADVIKSILTPILPGTPPSTPPIFGINPEYDVPASLVPYSYQGGLNSGNNFGYYLTNSAGKMVVEDSTKLPTNTISGFPYIPIFEELDTAEADCTISATSGSNQTTTTDTGYDLGNSQVLTAYTAGAAGVDNVGASIASDNFGSASAQTVAFYLRPGDLIENITFTKGDKTLQYDPVAKTLSTTDMSFVGDIDILSNGVCRFGITMINPTTDPIVIAAYTSAANATPAAVSENVVGFWVSTPVITNTPAMVPMMVSRASGVGAGSLAGLLPDVFGNDFMAVMTLVGTPTSQAVNKPIVTMGGITVSFTGAGYTIATNTGESYSLSSPGCDTFTRVAFSLSKSALNMKFDGGQKLTIPGDFTSLIPTDMNFTVGGFTGGISHLAVYAESDRDQMLEFLTDV